MKLRTTLRITAMVAFVSGAIALIGYWTGYVHRRSIWSIAVYSGASALEIIDPNQIENPVLTARDVTDIPADFIADPFMIREGDAWFLFFEALNLRTQHGDIGFATSADAQSWQYGGIVLDEPFHLSYPQVFRVEGAIYMIPESHEANAVRLYRADPFPRNWSLVAELIEG